MTALRGGAHERLLSAGHRLTPQRRLILEGLRRSRRTVTASELFERLRAGHPSLGRATVFRSLDALVAAGLAQRFERQGHVYAYAGCSVDHHHHLVCDHCLRATEIDEAVIAPLVQEVMGRYGFGMAHGLLDFHGVCASCGGQRR